MCFKKIVSNIGLGNFPFRFSHSNSALLSKYSARALDLAYRPIGRTRHPVDQSRALNSLLGTWQSAT